MVAAMSLHDDENTYSLSMRTERCVVCNKSCGCSGGHVHLPSLGAPHVFASYCQGCRLPHKLIAGCDSASGCAGWWTPQMGLVVELDTDDEDVAFSCAVPIPKEART